MKILVAPLDWGLGHATRCIPIITELTKQGHEVIIAADGAAVELLKQEFPTLLFVSLRGYRVKYYNGLPLTISIFLQIPKIVARIFLEHRALKKLISTYQIEKIISDNRFGLWSKKIHSVFITHQVMIKCPVGLRFLEPLLYQINKTVIGKYDECWIPDDETKISGDLSHRYPLPSNAKYIGLLSRWSNAQYTPSKKEYDLVAIVSGPEPQRSSFEKLLIAKLASTNLNSLIIQGKPALSGWKQINPRLTLVSHLKNQELLEIVTAAKLVICRAGYSSIMDLVSIRKNAILIPTPGQTEQLYLAGYLSERKIFFSMKQSNIHIEEAFRESQKYSIKKLFGETINS